MTVQIPGDIPIWPLGIIVLGILLVILWLRKPSFFYLLCFSIFTIYLLLVIDKTLLPIEISGPNVDAMRQMPFMSQVNLVPFYFGPYGTLAGSFATMILNIILTIPFGFGVNFVASLRAKTFLWLVPVAGVGIEATQLVISLILKYPYRFIDINDVIMNSLGVLIGYIVFRIFAWLYILVTQRLNIEHEGLAAYIYDIAIQAHTTNKSQKTYNHALDQ